MRVVGRKCVKTVSTARLFFGKGSKPTSKDPKESFEIGMTV